MLKQPTKAHCPSELKSSNETENVLWLTNWTIKRSKKHILIWLCVLFNRICFLRMFLNNKILFHFGHGLMGPFNPCTHLAVEPLMGNKCPDSTTWQTHGMYDISSENERPGEISHQNTISDRMPLRLVKNIYLYRQWEAWHACPLITSKHQGRQHF